MVRRQSQESGITTNIDFDLSRIRIAMVQPWAKHPRAMSVAAIIVGISLGLMSAYFDPIVRQAIQREMLPVGVIAAEILAETDSEDPYAHIPYKVVLEQYAGHLDRGVLAQIIDSIYPKFNTNVAVASALNQLQNDEISADVMWKVGSQLASFYKGAEKLPLSKGVKWAKPPNSTADLEESFRFAIKESRQKLRVFEDRPSMRAARALCFADRRTVLLLTLVWQYEIDLQLAEDFKENIITSHRLMGQLEKKDGLSFSDKHKLAIWGKNEVRHLGILVAILKDESVAEVNKLVKNAIETASKEDCGN